MCEIIIDPMKCVEVTAASKRKFSQFFPFEVSPELENKEDYADLFITECD